MFNLSLDCLKASVIDFFKKCDGDNYPLFEVIEYQNLLGVIWSELAPRGAGTHDALRLGDQLDVAEFLHDYILKPDQFWNHQKRLLEHAPSNKP